MAILTETKLHEDVSNGFNQLVIAHDLSIKRLVGYMDGEDDYYYILKNPTGYVHAYSYVSAVMPLYFLKNSTELSAYESLDTLASLNGAGYEAEMIIRKEWSIEWEAVRLLVV